MNAFLDSDESEEINENKVNTVLPTDINLISTPNIGPTNKTEPSTTKFLIQLTCKTEA
jgi:hypothetical protein